MIANTSSATVEAGVSFLLKYWQSPTIRLPQEAYFGENAGGVLDLIIMSLLQLRGHARWGLARRYAQIGLVWACIVAGEAVQFDSGIEKGIQYSRR